MRVPIARFLITRIFKIPPKILITQTFTIIFMTHFYKSVPLLTQVFPSTKNYVNGGVSVVQEFFKGSNKQTNIQNQRKNDSRYLLNLQMLLVIEFCFVMMLCI